MTLFSRQRLIKVEKIQEQPFPRTIQGKYFLKATQKITKTCWKNLEDRRWKSNKKTHVQLKFLKV